MVYKTHFFDIYLESSKDKYTPSTRERRRCIRKNRNVYKRYIMHTDIYRHTKEYTYIYDRYLHGYTSAGVTRWQHKLTRRKKKSIFHMINTKRHYPKQHAMQAKLARTHPASIYSNEEGEVSTA